MRLTLIYILCFGLKKSLSKPIKNSGGKNFGFKNCLKNLLKIIFGVFRYPQVNKKRFLIEKSQKKPWRRSLKDST